MAGRRLTIMWTWCTNIRVCVHKLILYLTEDAVSFYCKEQTVNPIEWNARFFSRYSCETHSSVHPSTHSLIHYLIPYSVLQKVHSLFQIKFSHRVRSSASSFNFHYSVFSLRSSHSCLRFLPRFTAGTLSFLLFLFFCVVF